MHPTVSIIPASVVHDANSGEFIEHSKKDEEETYGGKSN
jgi:hypothetical protein